MPKQAHSNISTTFAKIQIIVENDKTEFGKKFEAFKTEMQVLFGDILTHF